MSSVLDQSNLNLDVNVPSGSRGRPVARRPTQRVSSEATPERLRLDAALLQDFLDGLPDPISVAELANVLSIPRAVLHGRLRRGALKGQKFSSGWGISVGGNRDWIAARWKSSLERRRWSNAVRAEAVPVVVDAPEALSVLRGLMSSPMTASEAVAAALLEYRQPQ